MSVKNVMSSRRLCFIDVEINGVKNFKESTMHLKPRFLFVKPPNMNALVSLDLRILLCIVRFVLN